MAHPSDPNAWQVRCLLVEQLNVDLSEELGFVGQLLEVNTENNLMWHHRRCIAEKLEISMVASSEFKFTKKILRKDANNYLAWDHRQWVLQALGRKWTAELKFCEEILEKDRYNEFAWRQRYYVVTKCPPKRLEHDRRRQETHYAFGALALEPDNEIPWRYIRRLYKDEMQLLFDNIYLKRTLLSIFEEERDRVNAVRVDDVVYEKHGHTNLGYVINKRGCVLALEFVLDLLSHGYNPIEDLVDAINDLFPASDASNLAFDERVRLVLQSLGE